MLASSTSTSVSNTAVFAWSAESEFRGPLKNAQDGQSSSKVAVANQSSTPSDRPESLWIVVSYASSRSASISIRKSTTLGELQRSCEARPNQTVLPAKSSAASARRRASLATPT